MKKALFLFSLAAAFFLYGKDLVSASWQVLYAGPEASYSGGKLKAVPDNRGAAIARRIAAGEIAPDVTRLRIRGTGFEVRDLSLSLRGKTRISVQKAHPQKDGSLLFDFPGLPEGFSQVRLYFNSRGRLNKKAVSMQFTQIAFEADKIFAVDRKVRRRKMFEKTVIFPRIQTKYDLIKNYLSTYSAGTGTFVDRPLFFNRDLADSPLPEYNKQNSTKSFQQQLRSARMFVDGLGMFYARRSIRYMNPIRAAEAAGMKNCIFMEATPPGLKNTALMFKAIDNTLRSPAVFKHKGALVISSYHGEVFSPDQWKKVLAPYRKKYGKKVLFTIELRSCGYAMNSHYRKTGGRPTLEFTQRIQKRIRRYLDVADGVNFSASNHLIDKRRGFPENVLSIDAYKNYIIPVFVSVLAEKKYDGRRIFGLSAHKGYTQTRHTASNVDDEGTGSMRKSLSAALEANCDFIVMPEWNEINENTHTEPLVSNALTNVRVVNALRGRTVPSVEKVYPDIVLSFRQTNDLAAPIPIELLGLPEEKARPSVAVLHLYSPGGKKLRSFPPVTFSHKKTEDRLFLPRAADFARYRFLVPELEIRQGKKSLRIREGLPHIRLFSAPNVNNTYVKIPLRDLPSQGISAAVSLEGKNISASGRIRLPEKIMSVELLANENVLRALDLHGEDRIPKNMVLLRWMRSVPVAHGYNRDVLTLKARKGKVLLRTPHIFSLTGMKLKQNSPALISGRIGGGCCIREFFFFASPDAVLTFSDRKESFEISVSDLLKKGYFRHAGASGVSRIVEHCREQIQMPRPVGKNALQFSLKAPRRPDENTVYTVRVVTEKGRVWRSRPFMVPQKNAAIVQMPVWDLLDDKARIISVPRNLVRSRVFDFDPRYGALLPVRERIKEEAAVCGGFDYRSHSAKGWNVLRQPRWRQTGEKFVLDFTHGSGLLLFQPLFTRSAFDIRMEVSFNGVKNQTLLDSVGRKMTVNVTDGKLCGKITTSRTSRSWKSSVPLESGRFYRLRFTYDLKVFEVFVNDRSAAKIPVSGNFSDGWFLCIGGAPSGRKNVSNVLAKTASAHNTPDPAFKLQATLKALSISAFFTR